jgi:hypothetical protein
MAPQPASCAALIFDASAFRSTSAWATWAGGFSSRMLLLVGEPPSFAARGHVFFLRRGLGCSAGGCVLGRPAGFFG